jgi:hypothetical protein
MSSDGGVQKPSMRTVNGKWTEGGQHADTVPAIAKHSVMASFNWICWRSEPAIGHFTQVDTILPDPGKASGFDR